MKKKLIITLIVLLALAGAGTAAILLYRRHARTANPVKVYSLAQYLGDWYGNQTMMDGFVQAGTDQTVYLETDRIIREICVSPGDMVHVGDVLLKFDTELLELHIETLKAEHDVTLANIAVSKDELKRLKRIHPVPDNYEPEPSEAEKALQVAQEKLSEAEAELLGFEAGDEALQELEAREDLIAAITVLTELKAPEMKADMDPDDYQTLLAKYQEDREAAIEVIQKKKAEYDTALKAKDDAFEVINAAYEKANEEYIKADEAFRREQEGRGEEETYTKSQLALMIASEEKSIKDNELLSKQEEIEIKKEELSLRDGAITATRDGRVAEVNASEEDINMGRPVIRISGGSSFEAQITVDEWTYAGIEIGTEFQLMSYDTGMSYVGIVTEKSLSPVGENYWGATASNYTVTVAIQGGEDLTVGSWLQAGLGEGNAEEERMNTLVVPKYFLKEENGKFYAMKEDHGTLKKQYVTTGKIYYGEMIVVKEGLTASDSVAFPYEKAAVEGQATTEGSLDEFYGWGK